MAKQEDGPVDEQWDYRIIRHFNNAGDAHELTFSCFQRRPFLQSDRTRKWFFDALALSRKKHGFHLWGFVVMPEHVHLLNWFPQEEYSVEAALKSLKQSVGKKAVNFLWKTNRNGLIQLATGHKSVPYRFWQDGPGYDRNIHSIPALRSSLEYIHNNPVKRGLVASVEEWPWSSWGAWQEEPRIPIVLDLEKFPTLD